MNGFLTNAEMVPPPSMSKAWNRFQRWAISLAVNGVSRTRVLSRSFGNFCVVMIGRTMIELIVCVSLVLNGC